MRILKSMLLCLLLMATGTVMAEGPFTMEFEELADGVWAGVRADGPRFPVMGNTTFVIGDSGVVVYDGGGMPKMSELVIEKIRSLTDKPVTHVVISHWHGDHLFGVFRFAEEYPGVKFLAHEFTRDVINSSRINYVDRDQRFVAANLEEFEKIVATGFDSEGNQQSEVDRDNYKRIIADGDEIDSEFLRAKVTPPDIVFTDQYEIDLGNRVVELKYLGHANTAGDIVMWLPEDRIVATGDIVVLPSPYAFNVPPRAWSKTLRALNDLNYETLVPGHGVVQTSTDYVDLIIEASDSIAAQRDSMLADGKSNEEIEEALDFSAFEDRFTHGDDYVKLHYDQWFAGPFRKAATKALTGEPMVQIPPADTVPFDDERWQIEAAEHEIVDYLGQQALKIKGGSALLPELDVKNGLVEFDVAISEERGFAGLVFRRQDDANYENFYIRPHQSGNPDANQYQPVFNGVASWQLYHGPAYAAPVEYRYNEWMPVKILFAGNQADVYIDSDEPVLHIDDLRRTDMGGAIGLNSADFSAVHFANFRYTRLANAYEFPPAPEVSASDDTVMTWQVSDTFSADSLQGIAQLNESHMAERTWRSLEAEPTGIANLAQVQGIGEGGDTAFAMITMTADEAETRQLSLGYSDSAAVYLNGVLIYKGDNTYRSRDYRYLGTIGLFDNVALPLKKGENELCIAVTEAFGGWGVMGQVTSLHNSD
jgi:glyoxylase-like metal-dependent hydrolase (beta-lactamase superfamily II)